MIAHIKYMSRCLQLAANGLGTTYPNPLVGCVIILNDKIIAEGWHYQAGKPHAEVVAINRALAVGFTQNDFAKATLYVSLEPCSHFGKTPPCADLVISSGFKKVVIGTLDPHIKVAGNGVKKLDAAGIHTVSGVETDACKALNKRFFTFHKKKRPYIILKWAQTADSFIAPLDKGEQKPVWITNAYARQLVHKSRAHEHAILIGGKTALLDNPSLTTRDWYGNNPQRFVMSNSDLPETLALFSGNEPATIINHEHPENMVQKLYELGIQSVIIEGGLKTLQKFLDCDLWDEIQQYVSSTVYFKKGVPAPDFKPKKAPTKVTSLKEDTLFTYHHT